MERMSLIKMLKELYKIAWQKEFIDNKFDKETKLVHRRLDKLKEAKIWQRLVAGIPAFVIMFVSCYMASVYYMSSVLDEEMMLMHTLFKTIFFGTIIIGTLIQINLGHIISMTKWYKEQEAALLAREALLRKKHRTLMAAKTKEALDVFPGLGKEYLTTEAIGCMINYIKSGRADSIKEMITIYEKDCHRAHA